MNASPAVSVAAVDLGASSGRVAVARVSARRSGAAAVSLRVVHRFRNVPVLAGGTMHWDILRLHAEVLAGLRAAGQHAGLAGIGIDSWGVDYGLIDGAGTLLGNPVHYRDSRTEGAMARVLARIPAAELYLATGIQQLPFNTICQLASAAGTPQLDAAATLLMIPDLLGYWLTGRAGAEVTNASTTQLLDVRTRGWARSVIDRAGLPGHLFPELRSPGQIIGPLLPQSAGQARLTGRTGLAGLASPPLIAVGSHDTASAVAAVPAATPAFAFISCGTWSLVVSTGSRLANFSNEAGVDGTIRYLRNVAGLWLLQESLRTWSLAGLRPGLPALLDQAAAARPLVAVIDAGSAEFLAAGDMPARIARECRRTGQRAPDGPAETVRCILDSLALAHRRAVTEVQQLCGHHADAVHIVGGGSRNQLLCQLTADACGLPVIAGPAEAAALGNALIQARALGAAPPDLPGLRALVRSGRRLRRFEPAGDPRRWQAAQDRLAGV